MVRLNVVLAILLMASCVWLIRSSNEAVSYTHLTLPTKA